jgi:hypothetical protein
MLISIAWPLWDSSSMVRGMMQAHKGGKNATAGARVRNSRGKVHNMTKSTASMMHKGKDSRHQAATQARMKSRVAALDRRRHTHAPLVIQMLPLSSDVDQQAMWCVSGCS